MKKIHKKMLVQLLFGFLIGRVVLLERNPAGAAFFAGALAQGGGVVPLLFSVGLGMLSALPVEAVLRYGVGMLGIVVAKNLMKRQGMKWSVWQSSGLMAATLAVLSVTQYTILPYQWKDILFTILEPVLVVALARVFLEGQQYLFKIFFRYIVPFGNIGSGDRTPVLRIHRYVDYCHNAKLHFC